MILVELILSCARVFTVCLRSEYIVYFISFTDWSGKKQFFVLNILSEQFFINKLDKHKFSALNEMLLIRFFVTIQVCFVGFSLFFTRKSCFEGICRDF